MVVGDTRDSGQLEFLAPGLVHALGNQLFAIHAHAQVLGGDGGHLARERRAIVDAVTRAERALECLRWFTEGPRRCAERIDRLVETLCNLCHVTLRERGIHARHEVVGGATRLVDAVPFARALVEVLRALVERMPPGVAGELALEVHEHGDDLVDVRVSLRVASASLPFPIDTSGVVDGLAGHVAEIGGALLHAGEALTLRVPSLASA